MVRGWKFGKSLAFYNQPNQEAMNLKMLFVIAVLIIASTCEPSNSTSVEENNNTRVIGPAESQSFAADKYGGSWWDIWIKMSLKICNNICKPPLMKGRSCQQIHNGLWCCLKVDCGTPSQTGYTFDTPQPDTKYCATANVGCANGYETVPDKTTLKCQANGTWEKATGCSKKDCGIPEKTGYVFGDPVPDSLFGGEVSVSCASCYQGPPDKTELTCQANGQWEDVTGCTQIVCPAPESVEGYVIGDPTALTCGSTVPVQCAEGYVGGPDQPSLTCRDSGTWDTPTGCERRDCGPPEKTGYLFGEPDPDNKYGSVVSVSCDNCYQGPPTKTELTCQANGDWESVAGCTQIVCPAPEPVEGYVIGEPSALTCGSTVSVQCAEGYEDEPDQPSLTCRDSGTWDTPTGCERRDCGPPEKTGYLFGEPDPDTKYSSVVSVSCDNCYQGPPTKTELTCQANGQWESVAGCTKIVCGPPLPVEGYVIGEPTALTCGSTVSVQCAEGYEDEPDRPSLTCRDSGTWDTPTGCERSDTINCPGTLKDVQCESWGFRYAECPVPEADVILNAVVVKKDSISQCAYQGAGVAPANYTENMATLGLLGHMDNTLWVHSGCRARVRVCHTECGPWNLAYEHDENGAAVAGNKADLINKIKNGANVRVMIVRPNPYVTSIQNAYVVGNEVCGQALFHVSKANYYQFQDNAYWWFSNLCTTGHWQMSRYNVGEHVFRSRNTLKFALKWFVREEGQNHLVTLDPAGVELEGSKSNVVDAIKQGHHVRVSSTLTSTAYEGYNYSYPCDVMEYTADESLGVCTALWHVSQETVNRDGYYIKDFQSNAYWWFSLKTTNSNLKMSRWLVGTHSQPSSGNTETTKENKWYSDPCWQPVYKHDASGHLINGSLSSLKNYIRNGYRVKVKLQNLTLEADEIRIHNGHVCGSFLNDLSKSPMDTFPPTMSWVWRQCCTTGRCETMKYRVGENVETGDNSFVSQTLTWFVDTPRTWTRALSVAANQTVTYGSKATLTNAIRAGSEVRYNLVDVFEDDSDFLIAHLADNLAIEGDDVGATHIRAISVSRPAGQEIRFQNNPYWWFTITTTTGRLDRSRWTVGIHEDRIHDSRQIGVDWFVNDAA